MRSVYRGIIAIELERLCSIIRILDINFKTVHAAMY